MVPCLPLPFHSVGPQKSLTKARVEIFFSVSMAVSLLRAYILMGEPETKQESKPTITLEGTRRNTKQGKFISSDKTGVEWSGKASDTEAKILRQKASKQPKVGISRCL